MPPHDAVAQLFIQAAGAGVALNEFQIHHSDAAALPGKAFHGLEHGCADAVVPVGLAQRNGDLSPVAGFDAAVEGQLAVACDAALRLADDEAMVGGFRHAAQEAFLVLSGHRDFIRRAQHKGGIGGGVAEILHQLGCVPGRVGSPENGAAAVLQADGNGAEKHGQTSLGGIKAAPGSDDASPARAL